MDFGSAPIRVFVGKAHDQVPQFLRNSRSTAARSRSPAPEEAKAGAVPSDDSFWLDNQEDIGPTGPKAAEGGPEEAVARIQGRPRSLAFEHGDLLSQSEDLQGCVASRTEENAESTPHSEEQMDHELMVPTRCPGLLKPLISR